MKIRLTLAAWLTAAVTVALAAGSGGTAQAALAHPQTPAPPVINLDSCTGASFCLANGYYYSKPGQRHVIPLAEVWNGKTWRILRTPTEFGGAITCTGPSFCLAAGPTHVTQFQEHVWNGKIWQKLEAQPPDPDIQCFTPKFCVTRNSDQSGEVYWTGGSTWPAMPGTSAGCGGAWCGIDSWDCGSATNCWDSGSYCGDSDCDDGVFSYTDIWNGVTWSDSTYQAGPGFTAYKACAGRAFCMSMNPPGQAAITNDRGNSWHSASLHLATACRHLTGCDSQAILACASPRYCLALGSLDSSGSLAWNGTEWGSARLALVNGQLPDLNSLYCGSSRNCMATGTYQLTPTSTPQPVAEHWNGNAWQVTNLVIP